MTKEEFFSPHFTLAELTRSRTAVKKHLTNDPDGDAISALQELCRVVLEPLRRMWDEPIIVTSGYRSPRLNRAVGGVPNSQHCLGMAADIVAVNPEDTITLGRLAQSLQLPFDQLIFEGLNRTETCCQWIHISYNPGGKNRNVVLRNYN